MTTNLAPGVASVAIVSLLPDTGHVIPLLRIGAALKEAGHPTTAYLPDECQSLASEYGIRCIAMGDFDSPERRAAAAHFQYSRWRSHRDSIGIREYLAILEATASSALPRLLDLLRQAHPEVMLVDVHLCHQWYRWIAFEIDAFVLEHYAEGTLQNWNRKLRTSPHAKSSGRSVPMWRRSLPLMLDSLLDRFRDCQFDASPTYRSLREQVQRRVSGLFGDDHAEGRSRMIATGLGVIELDRFAATLEVPENVTFLGPVMPSQPAPLPDRWVTWLNLHGHRSVVYLSFGTMVSLTPAMVRIILDALDELALAIIWAVPKHSMPAFAGVALADHIAVEPRLPQRALLAAPQVKCCVTHGGAGTVQEALWEGKPLLCMPVMWDQFYNADLVERLGAGRQLSWTGLSSRRIVAALRSLVSDDLVGKVARGLREELVGMAAHEDIVEVVRSSAPVGR